ncbi:cysteine--tRNA ligase [Salibaculum griseiflavum]|uniref:Cysteine--tRNA ligase n=1 Tax=Salibaculum griseiflavum TaxID=1914409 RepID=A0A2V1P3K2_9RHOB|nr:cysteine--tRNA ligase [Salibaculum griseiflavum]PWG16404.1 cysteine--tRNA ligase [Salibaculum griseiflavum]
MTIKLYNTKTKTKEVFEPLDRENVRMYVCGPTVYDRAHLGNARPVLVFDVLYRLLRHTYGADHVTYVRNFTDVDDKINATALARKEAGAKGTLEELVHDRSDETIDWYHQDMDALGALRPTKEPRATEWIGAMIAMIEDLIAKGHAYEAEGHVLFAVESYADYGALSGRSVDDMIAGARVEVAPYKRNPMDFVLWKPSDDELPGWDSPWGRGRPGWHIECSAMSYELLGESFDIHGGGNDLQFPHHENEIAQSKCAHPEGDFARVWMHNEMLQVEGKKMSKSLGNFFTVRDLLDQGVPGEVIRFVMLSTHYRKPMDWTEERVREAKRLLFDWHKQTMDFAPTPEADMVPSDTLVNALSEDLNTYDALSVLRRFRNDPQRLLDNARFMGFLTDETRAVFKEQWFATSVGTGPNQLLAALGQALDHKRKSAMQTKDFSEVDRMKAALIDAGAEVRMSKEGVDLVPGPDFDPAKLEGLL